MTSDVGLASSAYSFSSSSPTNGIPELRSQAGLCVGGGAEEKVQGGKVCGSSLAPIGYRFEARVAIDGARNQTKSEVGLSWPFCGCCREEGDSKLAAVTAGGAVESEPGYLQRKKKI